MNKTFLNQNGFTLIEVVTIILIIGVIATVATLKMNQSIETALYEQTKREMDQLTAAIVGNPELNANGARTDFGYVGDVGAFPGSLDDLVTNPGGYSTWNGPYIAGDFQNNGYKLDGWNVTYVYLDSIIRSIGSGSNIDKRVVSASTMLFDNQVAGSIRDANNDMPGATYDDSLTVLMVYPNGSGSITSSATHPNHFGSFSFSGIPVGNHTLRVIYQPDSDTVSYPVTVYPGKDVKLNVVFPADLW